MKTDLSSIAVPRLVKKPGEHKRVDTRAELEAALADGWVLRLETTPEHELVSALTADLEPQELEAETRGHRGGKKK